MITGHLETKRICVVDKSSQAEIEMSKAKCTVLNESHDYQVFMKAKKHRNPLVVFLPGFSERS